MDCLIINYIIQGAIAVGTVGALFAALFQIWRESSLRNKEKKMMQAINVAAWLEDAHLSTPMPGTEFNAYYPALIRNDNLIPIYDVVVTVVGFHGAGPFEKGEDNKDDFGFRVLIPQVPNGLWGTWIDTGGGDMGVICTLEIAFRDGAGISWVRRGNGELIELSQDPLSFYSIPLPPSWSDAERVSL